MGVDTGEFLWYVLNSNTSIGATGQIVVGVAVKNHGYV
jgi:hypothetical protein